MIKRILAVCTGNICRSPIAEGLLGHHAAGAGLEITVSSTGIAALVGEAPHEHAQSVMQEWDLDISRLRAVQCNQTNLMSADLILAMDNSHLRWLHRNFPQIRGRVMLMGKWDDDKQVPDPYGSAIDRFRLVRDQLDEYSDLWCDWLSKMARRD